MNALETVEQGILFLSGRDDDRASERNDIGFSGMDTNLGNALAGSVGAWSPRQAEIAWAITQRYSRTQLSHLQLPTLDSVRAELKVRDEAKAAELREVLQGAGDVGESFGLVWSQWKTVQTAKGLAKVRSAVPTQELWAAWRANKDALKAKGISVSSYQGAWKVSEWAEVAGGEARPAAPTVPYEVRPLANTACLTHFPWQADHAARLVAAIRSCGSALDCSDMGTGKTWAALGVARELGVTAYVVAPKPVLPAWAAAAAAMGVNVVVSNWEMARTGKVQNLGTWADKERKFFNWNPAVKFIIFDEVHRAKNSGTLQNKLVAAAKRQNLQILMLSATAAQDPRDMSATGYALGLHSGKDFYKWVFANGCTKGFWGGLEFRDKDGFILNRIHKAIFPHKGSRVRIADLGDMFPETRIVAERIDFGDNGKIQKAYAEMENELDRLADTTSEDGDALPITVRLRARQKVELLKVPAIVEMAEDALAQNNTVVIFVNFNETLSSILEALADHKPEWVAGELNGKPQKAEDRQATVSRVQSGECRLVVANIKAGGVGIGFHNKNFTTVLVSPSDSAADMKQAFGRVPRAGGGKSIQRVLCASGTVEESIVRSFEQKNNQIEMLNDGDLAVMLKL